MSDRIRISVVLASYNGSTYIAEQVESLLRALSGSDEIVVADDASTDATLHVLDGIADPRLRVLRFETRVGYQRNFERAIAAARGDYMFFSDQDDVCLPERIPLSLEALQRRACVCGDATLVDADLKPIAASFFSTRGADRFDATHLLFKPAVIGATIACRREHLLANVPFPTGVPHDHWLSVVAAAQDELEVIRQPLILYRRHASVASLTGLTDRRRSIGAILGERVRLLRALWRHRRLQ